MRGVKLAGPLHPAWQKAILLVSSLPVALACNFVRLAITAVVFGAIAQTASEEFLSAFHDVAGWLMMPVAIFLLMGELWLLEKLTVAPEPVPAARKKPRSRDRKSRAH